MKKFVFIFFIALSIALISTPALCQMQQGRLQTESDTSMDKGNKGEIDLESSSAEHKTVDWKDYNVHDPGIAQDEVQLVKTPSVVTPDDEIDLPDKYNTKDPDIETMVVKDTTPTCEEIFTVIAMKQEKGEELTWYDQSMRARCLDQPKPEDDDEVDEPRDDLYSLDQPITDHQTEGGITRIYWKIYKGGCPGCPDQRVSCPGCLGDGQRGNGPSSGQSVNSSQSTNQGSSVATGSQPSTGNYRNSVR